MGLKLFFAQSMVIPQNGHTEMVIPYGHTEREHGICFWIAPLGHV